MKNTLLLTIITVYFIINTSFISGSANVYRIVVDKSDYELSVYSGDEWIVSYPVVFGNKDLSDKLYEGDRRTPEGSFRIIAKKPHNKWYRFMQLDYPNAVAYEKFNQRKQSGVIPAYAKIGGSIGIHGTWPNEDWAVDKFQNWTQGCISLKNEHMAELYQGIPVGTEVIIQK